MTNDRFVQRTIIILAAALLGAIGLIALVGWLSLGGVDAQALHACERANVQRAEDNASHYADFHVDSFVVQRFTVPTKTETAAQKRITAEFASTLHQAVAAKSWVPLTNCQASAGSAYKAPQPISFSAGLPLLSALDPVNAARADPEGSRP